MEFGLVFAFWLRIPSLILNQQTEYYGLDSNFRLGFCL